MTGGMGNLQACNVQYPARQMALNGRRYPDRGGLIEEEKTRGGCDGFLERNMLCLLKWLGSTKMLKVLFSWQTVVVRALECLVVEAGLAKCVRNNHSRCGCVLRFGGGTHWYNWNTGGILG